MKYAPPSAGSDFGFVASGFDPALIVGQIVTMQALLYISLGAWLLLLNGLIGRPATAVGLEHVFSAGALELSYPGSSVSLAAFFFNAIAGGGFLMLVVERAKKCLDFAATAHILHLLGCAMYDGFPESWEWWVVTLASLIVMALLGEYLCMRREMRDIPLFHGR